MSLLSDTLEWLKTQCPDEPEYLQAVNEILPDIVPIVHANEAYKSNNVLQRILIPQHIHQFAVQWETDKGTCAIDTGWRVQHCNVLGPYKGGTRFDPSVNLSTLKFLAFEQTFKNALTGLAIGSAKGGAVFNPKGKSQGEIRRFCKAYISVLSSHIGATIDVPAGDINVSEKEIGIMFGELLRQSKLHEGALSGKPTALGGSALRIEATGYGVMYFIDQLLKSRQESIASKEICISGAGNVALYTAEKAIEMGACVLTLANSKGTYFYENGLSQKHLNWLKEHSSDHDNALKVLAEEVSGEFIGSQKPWQITCDIAIPCATQNEINKDDAAHLIKHTKQAIVEGANMPCDAQAIKVINESGLIFVPGKAANAGGVILSTFEMQQHSSMRYEAESALDKRLRLIMQNIHDNCLNESKNLSDGASDYVRGANVIGFRRLADAMVASGY